MDYSLVGSNILLTIALFRNEPYWFCAVALTWNLLTTLIVFYRAKANLTTDIMPGGYPLYNKWHKYTSTLTTIAGMFPMVFMCLSAWFVSTFCWWVAFCMWVVDMYVLFETLESGYNRIRYAEKKFKDGNVWKGGAWVATAMNGR